MFDSTSPHSDLLRSILEPLLEDFQYWFQRSRLLLETEALPFLSDEQRAIDFMGMPFWGGQGFGLGLSMITDPEKFAWMGSGSTGSFGWPGAFGTWWQADPEEDLIILYMVQNSMDLGPEAVTRLMASQRMGARLALPMVQRVVYGALGK